jgi:hypothetical protein
MTLRNQTLLFIGATLAALLAVFIRGFFNCAASQPAQR